MIAAMPATGLRAHNWMRWVLFSALGMGLLSLSAGGGTLAYFTTQVQSNNNTFTAGSTTFTETGDANHFASPVFIGSQTYAGGAITSWRFTSNTGPAASVGQNGFGIFLQPSATTPVSGLSSLILGYDDQQFTGDDDNHDDLMILARIRAPEPSSWAIMITGFGLAGAALRRRRQAAAA